MNHRTANVTVALAALVVLATGFAPASAQAPAAKPPAAKPPAAAPAPAAQPAEPAAAPAAPAEEQPFDAARLADQALGQVSSRLKLTNSQIVRIRPLLMDTMTKLREVLIDYSSPDGVMFPALVQEFRGTRDRFRSSLEPILSPQQMNEFMVIRHEVDAELRDTICDARLAAVKPRLALRPDQDRPVRDILCKDFEAKRDLVAGMTTSSGGPASPRPPAPLYQKIQDETEAHLRQALTPAQMKSYEAYRDELKAKAQPPAH